MVALSEYYLLPYNTTEEWTEENTYCNVAMQLVISSLNIAEVRSDTTLEHARPLSLQAF
jgi:hypothetical protein